MPSPSALTPASHAEPAREVRLREAPLPHTIPNLTELYATADAHTVALTETEFAQILHTIGERCHYNQPAGANPTAAQRDAFFRGLHLAELALAHACAFGRDAAWRLFLARFREPLVQAATAITGSVSLGRDLADALPSELFGLSTSGDGTTRRSPLASYSGRGSLLGWLRSTLAQRHVDHHRRTRRESPLPERADEELSAAEPIPTPAAVTLTQLEQALTAVLRALDPEDAFVLSAWFLDGRTLLHIAKLLRVSEATVSRRLKRLTGKLHTALLTRLQAAGLSRRAADEALGTDPRDLTLPLRGLLQSRASSAFQQQAPTTPKVAE